MLTFLGKRLLQLIPTLFFVSVIIFSLQQLLPGDPALVMAGEDKDPEVIAQIRQQMQPEPDARRQLGGVQIVGLLCPPDEELTDGVEPRAALVFD